MAATPATSSEHRLLELAEATPPQEEQPPKRRQRRPKVAAEPAPAPATESEAILERLAAGLRSEDEPAPFAAEQTGKDAVAAAAPARAAQAAPAPKRQRRGKRKVDETPERAEDEATTPSPRDAAVPVPEAAAGSPVFIATAAEDEQPTEEVEAAVEAEASTDAEAYPEDTVEWGRREETAEEEADEGKRRNGPRVRRGGRANIFEAQRPPLDPVEALLEFFRANPRPWPARELVRRLPATDLDRLGGRRGLESTLERLVAEGKLVNTRRFTYGLPEEMNLVVGRFQGHSGGFGFLIPETPGLRDLYIPPDATMAAWNGDRVVARTAPRRRAPGAGGGGPVTGRNDDAPRGQIIRILERSRDRLVGTLEYSKGYAILRPDDPKLNHRLLLVPEGTENVPAGGRIVARLFWPEDTGEDEPYGQIEQVLGFEDSPEVETKAVVVKYELAEEFSPAALVEAEKIPLEIPAVALRGRTDLRGKSVFTIDGRDAKDFDDAIHIEPLGNGNFLVGVHIADVSHYVQEGKPLDKDARERATSVYLPGKVLPMLPERISNGVCSLVPDEDRLTLSALVELTPDGSVVNYQLVNSVIHSKARLTYDDVQAFSEGKASLPEQYRFLEGDMHLLLKLTTRMRERRFREGSLDFRLREVKVDIQPDGTLALIPIREETARGLIEDLMLLANKIVAAHLAKEDIPALFRVHEEPSEQRFQEVTAALDRMGVTVPNTGSKKKGKSGPTPQAYQEILANVRGTPQESAVNTLLLRSMRQAKYSSENKGHFGLAFDDYLHFTSPIRRYPDLIVHRILKLMLGRKLTGARREQLAATLPGLGEHTSERERNAEEAERDLTKYYQAKWAQAHLGEQHEGAVSGVTSFGLFVALDNGVEGLLHVSQLDDDYYVFLEDAMILRGRSTGRTYRIGTRVNVRIQHVNPVARQIDFAPKETDMDRPRGRRGQERPRFRAGAFRQPPEGATEQAPERDQAPPEDSDRSETRRVVVLSGRPKGEHNRPVKVTARRLYFGEWTRSNLEAADEEGGRRDEGRPGDRGDRRPSGQRGRDGGKGRDKRRGTDGGERRPPANASAGRPPAPAQEPRNAERASAGPREGKPRPPLRFAGGAEPAQPATAAGSGGKRRRRKRR